MKIEQLLLYLIFILSILSSCNSRSTETIPVDNWANYNDHIKDLPQFENELKMLQELRASMYKEDFNYANYLKSRIAYLNQVEELVKSNKKDSLKLGVITPVIASNSLLNSREKRLLFSHINTDGFSPELIDNYKGYLSNPKYQIGDTLDIDKVFSYETNDEISLTLKSEVNIIFFWSSWCANCDRYYAPINNLIEKYNDSRLNVVGISLDQKESQMKKYQRKHGFKFKSYSDLNKKWKSENAERFGVDGIPVCLVVNNRKELLSVNEQANHLEKLVDAVLDQNEL